MFYYLKHCTLSDKKTNICRIETQANPAGFNKWILSLTSKKYNNPWVASESLVSDAYVLGTGSLAQVCAGCVQIFGSSYVWLGCLMCLHITGKLASMWRHKCVTLEWLMQVWLHQHLVPFHLPYRPSVTIFVTFKAEAETWWTFLEEWAVSSLHASLLSMRQGFYSRGVCKEVAGLARHLRTLAWWPAVLWPTLSRPQAVCDSASLKTKKQKQTNKKLPSAT